MEHQYKKVIVVDEDDAIIGAEYMMDAMEKGMLRRGARVFVFNESGQLLVQQRSENVLKPLLLDQSAAGHVDEGETYEEAAYRELKEELGLDGLPLTLVATSFRTPQFYNGIYKLVIPDNTEIAFDRWEVKYIFWYTLDDLNTEIQNNPEKFTPALKVVWSLLGDTIVNA